ncbi:MAG TPA: response regulator transcription factor [Drouetiella sp.]
MLLMVDDDVELAHKLKDWLASKSLQLDLVHNGQDALQLLRTHSFDVILLDWHLPDITGLDVCQRYRKVGGMDRIIFLTGEEDLENKEAALLSGGDDYVTKPFEMRELYARIRSVTRRSPVIEPDLLTIKGVAVDCGSYVATVDGRSLILTRQEFAVLEFLMRHANKPYTSGRLLSTPWPSDSDVSEGNVRMFILNLRRKLEAVGKPDFIKTVINIGYVVENK